MQYNYSVIVPYRDKYSLFIKAVDSIPDRNDIQIIIVDNAPQPLSTNLIPKKTLANVTYLTSSPTKGAGCARNRGLQCVDGRYILFLDADDYFTPEAFAAFDKYLEKNYDIVFFKPTSIKLCDGTISDRHECYAYNIDLYIKTGEEKKMRYRWEVPWGKLFRTSFILKEGFLFDELKVNNDAWFSLMTGHNAKCINADQSIVYVVTEGETGQSLVKTVTKENAFIRYEVSIRINKFLKTIGHYDMRIRLLGALRIALTKFGVKEFCHYLRVAYQNRIGIF